MTSRTVAIAFLYGLFLLWLHYATQPKPTPPDRGAKRSNVPDTGEIEKIARKLGYRKAG